MTVVVSASASAPTPAPAATHVRAPENGGHGFSSALDALTAGDGKAKSADEGDKRTSEDAADTAPASPSADLRAALMGGAWASLPMPSKPVADIASQLKSARGTPAPLPGGSLTDSPALAGSDAGAATTGMKSLLGARVTAERAYVAPAAFANTLGAARDAAPVVAAQAEARGPAISTAAATAPGQRGAPTASAPTIAATATSPGNAASAISATDPSAFETAPAGDALSSAAALRALGATPVALPAAAALPSVSDQGATARATSSAADTAASGAPSVEAQQPAAGTSLPHSAPTFTRATATAHAARPGSAERAASAPTTPEQKADHGDAANPGASGGQGANAPLQGAAFTVPGGAASPFAAMAQVGAASSASSTSSAPSAAAATPAATIPAATRVHEIDLDLSSGGLADVSMTVRLAGDKLGVVIRAASGETAATIEGARDAIADRLAAIGQPVSSIIIQQTDGSDATGGSGQSKGEGEGRPQQDQHRDPDDTRGSRRGGSRN